MLSFISILLLYYVWILNVNATKWDNIRQLTIQMEQLKLEKQLLDAKIAEIDSFSSLEQNDNMQDVENPDYLVIKENVNYVYNY